MIKILNSEFEISENYGTVSRLHKRGIKDIKRKNRQTIVNLLLENDGLSRVEIAQRTELAGSTVSALVTELLAEGVLIETGSIGTAGRSRTTLSVNPAFGSMAVVEIGRQETRVVWFDMLLQQLSTEVISRRYVAGNQLLSLITNHIREVQHNFPQLVGLGLLFQEDMRESDFRVMYSTGFSSASITLKEALITQYRIPIEEEYSVVYTVTHALAEEYDLDARNSAHISVGSRVLASVALNGVDVPLRSDFCEEFACAMELDRPVKDSVLMMEYLSKIIVMLCMLFPLETVFLSGNKLPEGNTEQHLHNYISKMLTQEKIPILRHLRTIPRDSGSADMAAQVRKRSLIV